jgi:hypothetical protein
VLVVAIAALWAPLGPKQHRFVLLLAGTLVFARFLIVFAALGASLLSQVFLADREREAIAALSTTSAAVEQERPDQPESSIFDRFGAFLEDPAKALNVDGRIERLKEQSESAITELINLIVVYALKTLLLPIAVLYVALGAARAALRMLMEELT